jgi:hypothetical protein
MYERQLVPKSILKQVKKSILQGGVVKEQVTYELDNEKISNLMLVFADD